MTEVTHHSFKAHIVMLLASLTVLPVLAGSNESYTVGPHPSCDYPTINEAISSGFPCNDPNGCVAGDPTLLLSQNYFAQELIFINQSISIIGGSDNSCDGTSSDEIFSVIASAGPNTSGKVMFIHPPSEATIDVLLKNVAILAAHGNSNNQGGAIVMDPGFAEPGVINLTLWNSSVSGGLSQRGGGVYMSGNHRLTLLDSDILSNEALAGSSFEGNGGGIFCNDGGHINFISGSIKFNDATSFGGGIYLDNCHLTGQGINTVRTVESNQVLRNLSDTASGKGGGIFAKGGSVRIELGGLLSRTLIKNNVVAEWLSEEFLTFSNALGGGLHLEAGAQAVLRNTEFIGNEAPDGGGVSMQSGSILDMDRTSGPCLTGSEEGCSVFLDNKATGDLWAGGGSAVYTYSGGNEGTTTLDVKRSVFVGNDAFQHNGDGGYGSLFSTFNSDASISGNLFHSNSIEDDTGILTDNYGNYFAFRFSDIDFLQNTVAYNENSGAVIHSQGAVINAAANIIYDPTQEYGLIDDDYSDQIFYYACNISSEIWFENIIQNGGSNSLVESEPDFFDSSVANFRLQSSSIATNVCDDQGGLLNLGFDIAGRARPQDGGQTPKLGLHDAGAFEYQVGSATEVDLVMVAKLESDSGRTGAKYRVSATNIGLKPMIHSDLKFSFPVQGNYEFSGVDWECVTINNSNPLTVECSSNHNSLIAVGTASFSLFIELSPDSSSQCELDVTAVSSATQIDTDLSNNHVYLEPINCSVQDLIFENGFE